MSDRVAVYMLDVGQGDSTIVLLPDDRVVVFDCADDHVLRQILTGWKTTTIAAFVLSHLDQDHIAGALAFLQGFTGTVEKVCLSNLSSSQTTRSHSFLGEEATSSINCTAPRRRSYSTSPRVPASSPSRTSDATISLKQGREATPRLPTGAARGAPSRAG